MYFTCCVPDIGVGIRNHSILTHLVIQHLCYVSLRCLRQDPGPLNHFYAFIYSCHKYFSALCVSGAGLSSAHQIFLVSWIRLEERRIYPLKLCLHWL